MKSFRILFIKNIILVMVFFHFQLLTDAGRFGREALRAVLCVRCHMDKTVSLTANPHQKIAADETAGNQCTACHGDPDEHLSMGGGSDNIMDFSENAPAQEIVHRCLKCHEFQRTNYSAGRHGGAGLPCTACHRVHTDAAEPSLLFQPHEEICLMCHGMSPSHQELGGSLCIDCHDPH